MTNDEHRELDKDVHHLVFGFTPYEVDDCVERNALPHYSTEIDDAWEVVEATRYGKRDNRQSDDFKQRMRGRWHGTSEEVAEAICRAALLAVCS